jgi:hypothetical protein
MLVIYVRIVGIPMYHIFPCNILVTRDLGRMLVIFYVIISLPSLGLTMGICKHVCRVCESRGS